MAIVNGYCSVSELKIHIEQTKDTSTAMTTRAEQIINQSSRLIDKLTGRIFYSKSLSSEKVDMYALSENGLYLNRHRRIRLLFPSPIISISSLVEDSISLTNNTDYFIYNNNNYGDSFIIKDGEAAWTTEHKGIVISGSIGYESTPDDIKNLCVEISAIIMRSKESFITGSDGEILGQLEKRLPSLSFNLLKMLRRKFIV